MKKLYISSEAKLVKVADLQAHKPLKVVRLYIGYFHNEVCYTLKKHTLIAI